LPITSAVVVYNGFPANIKYHREIKTLQAVVMGKHKGLTITTIKKGGKQNENQSYK